MKKKTPARAKKAKLTDTERHARFVETAKKVEASESPEDFDRAFTRVTATKKEVIKPTS